MDDYDPECPGYNETSLSAILDFLEQDPDFLQRVSLQWIRQGWTPAFKVFLYNIDHQLEEELVRDFCFETVTMLLDFQYVRQKQKCFAFLLLATPVLQQQAVNALHGRTLGSRTLKARVTENRPSKNRSQSSYRR